MPGPDHHLLASSLLFGCFIVAFTVSSETIYLFPALALAIFGISSSLLNIWLPWKIDLQIRQNYQRACVYLAQALLVELIGAAILSVLIVLLGREIKDYSTIWFLATLLASPLIYPLLIEYNIQ